MSMATPSVLTGSSIVAPDRNKIEDDESKSSNVVRNATPRNSGSNQSITMDRQPMAPRRSISPVHRRPPEDGNDATIKATNTSLDDNADDSDGDSTIDEDLEYIAKLYGGDAFCADNEAKADCLEYLMTGGVSPKTSFALPPPPPLQHINENDSSPFSKTKHDYDSTRQPVRSSMRKPNSKARNMHSIDNSQHKSDSISRGVSRNHSADGTEDTRRGSGSLHSVRMRGSIYPVHRRQSIGFEETVRVQEVTPTVELNDGNTRDLWLQADEAMEIKERRRQLLKRYKEREARKKREAEQRINEQQEKMQRQQKMKNQQKVKNLLNPTKNNNKNNLNAFLTQTSAQAKKQPKWGGILKKPDLPLPGNGSSPASRRWKTNLHHNEHPSVMGLSAPSRGGDVPPSTYGLYMGNATNSFMSTSSGGSSFSGHDSDSFRGLEKYVDRSGKHQKNMVWDAVFLEQDEQLQFGYYDDERIATLYRTVQNQHDGQQKAVGRARKDRKAADNYLMTPRTLKLLKKTINVNPNSIPSLACGDLLEDKSTEDNEKNTATTNGDSNGLGNHGRTETDDKNDASHERTSGQTTPKAGTAALKGSGKRHNKFLRRLSV